MKILVFDTESDGLVEQATKIHVMAWTEDGKQYQYTHDYNYMKELIDCADLCVAHNSIRHDLPLFNKILGTEYTYEKFVDSLALSWYLNYNRPKHGLESYERESGVIKPKVLDWENLTPEDYAHRCVEDVKINWWLWENLRGKLDKLYGPQQWKYVTEHLSFKMDCAREQEEMKWRLDIDKAKEYLADIEQQEADKKEELAEAMPRVRITKTYKKPKRMFNKDSTLTVYGKDWMENLRKAGLPPTHSDPFELTVGSERANPSSVPQVKDWLDKLGWKPRTFKFVKDEREKTGERKVPQLRYPKGHPEEGHLCASVVELAEKDPAVLVLEGLSVLQHRKGFFKGMIETAECHPCWCMGGRDNCENNCGDTGNVYYVVAQIDGLTNTWRFKHKKPLANIPGVDKPWGKEIRSCLIAPNPEDTLLCGADMTSLESTTKRHYMMKHDPEYVEEMSKPGFDEHLDLAKHAGAVTALQVEQHKIGEVDLSSIRKAYKATNYSAIYGIGPPKLARDLSITIGEAAGLLQSYWKRNAAVKLVSQEQYIETIDGEKWLKNPVSGIYHQLRYEKDIFSTLNQSTGVFCFDMWMLNLREMGVKFCGQFHDENIAPVTKSGVDSNTAIYREALDKTNQMLKLDVPLGIDIKYGRNYAVIH